MKRLNDIQSRFEHLKPPQKSQVSQEIEPYIIYPRYLKEHYRDRLITYRELELYNWMRLHTNLYGVAGVNTTGLLNDLPHFKSANRVTKVMRSLLKKKYIYYEERKGCRGTFNVHFGDWLLKDGVVLTLDRYFKDTLVTGSDTSEVESADEIDTKLSENVPMLVSESISVNKGDIAKWRPPFVRGGNNDIEKEKKKETNDLSNPNNGVAKQLKITTFDFIPKTYEEQRCKEIAIEINDSYINFTLSILRDKQGGIDLLEEALSAFKEAKGAYSVKGTTIKNSGALFNKIVKGLKQRNKYSKYG